jgi:hypothetical protein
MLVFRQLQSLNVTTKYVYFPLKYALKLIENFPSLIHIELRVISLVICASIFDILLNGLVNLLHLKIFYDEYSLLDDLSRIGDAVEKRRQAFSLNINNKDEVSLNFNKQFLEIYLRCCSICANKTYDI